MRPAAKLAFLLGGLTVVCRSGEPTEGAGCLGTICQAAKTDPLRVSADRHWLEFRGQKTLLIGDSVTQGWMECGTHFDQAAYVDALASRGINVLMLWTYIGITDQIGDSRIGYDAPEIWPWVRSGGFFDLNQFNTAYFDRLRALVQLADGRDLTVLITIHDGWTKTRFAGHPFNAALGGPLTASSQYVELHNYSTEMPPTYDPGWTRQQKHQYFLERFCDRIIQATADQPNVMYEMFNEGEWYDQTKLRAFQVHFLNFFKARTPRVIMVNDDHVGDTDFRGEANCDVISWHRPNWGSSTRVTDSFNYYYPAFAGSPVKPFFFSEPVPEYQGDSSQHDGLMRLMWGTVLAGAGFVVQNDTSFGFDPRAAIASEAADRDVVLDREGHCARFFNACGVEFWTMVPNGALSSSGVCLADPGREYVVYSQSGTSTFDLDMSAGTGTFNCRFYNPKTGQFGAPFQPPGGGTQSFSKPDSGDWVLHVVELPHAPVAVINADPTGGRSPLPVSLDGSASYDTDGGAIVGYVWDFENDGTTDATGPTVEHVYVGKQAAVVKLTVKDNDGHTGTAMATISVTTFPGDFDGDGDVDQEDFGFFQQCFSGSGVSAEAGCEAADLNADGDVDKNDFSVFFSCLSGSEIPVDMSCGP